MRILLTGCAGFIGSHLSERLLKEGHEVIGIDNFDPFYDRAIKERNLSIYKNQKRYTFYEVDFREKGQLTQIEGAVDMVIHLAAKAGVLPSLKNPDEYVLTNVLGTNNILELMRMKGCTKLVFASSSSVYGNNKKIPFSEEDDVNQSISPYAFTKRSCELMNYNYHHLYNMDILNLRLFTVYGPRQRPDLAIHKFIRLISEGSPINMYGDGSTSRDYTFVMDTVQGIMQAIDYLVNNQNVYETINLGNNTPVKLSELIDTIYTEMNTKPNINLMPMQPGDVDITYADISKAKRLLNYQPTTTLSSGIRRFIQWFNEQQA